MSREGTNSLVLQLLRDILAGADSFKADMAGVKERLGRLCDSTASIARRLDRLGDRLECIRVRLERAVP